MRTMDIQKTNKNDQGISQSFHDTKKRKTHTHHARIQKVFSEGVQLWQLFLVDEGREDLLSTQNWWIRKYLQLYAQNSIYLNLCKVSRWWIWSGRSNLFDYTCHNLLRLKFLISWFTVKNRFRVVGVKKSSENDQYIYRLDYNGSDNICMPSKDSDQPGHQPSLNRLFSVHMKKQSIISYSLTSQWMLWCILTDAQADLSLFYAHTSLCIYLCLCNELALSSYNNMC